MLVKEVLIKYHKIVPFPWTPSKIKKAGHDPMRLASVLSQELCLCEDKVNDSAKAVVDALRYLEMIP